MVNRTPEQLKTLNTLLNDEQKANMQEAVDLLVDVNFLLQDIKEAESLESNELLDEICDEIYDLMIALTNVVSAK